MANNFDRILDECIDRISRGERLESCLADYPENVEQLKPLLQAMLQTKDVYEFKPSPSAKKAAKQRFNATLKSLEQRRQEKQPLFPSLFGWSRALATVAVVIVIALIGYFGLRPMLFPAGTIPQPGPVPIAPGPTTQPPGPGLLTGTIEVRVTDAPPEYGTIKEIWVTVVDSEEGIMVHKAATEEDGEGEWIPIPVTGDNPFELLELKEQGVDALLGWAEVPTGKYTQIRMTIEQVEVIFEGETDPIEAKLPSGKLKLVRPFDVIDGETTILLLDFIADESVTITGQGDVIFKPVIKLVVSGKEKPIELESSLETTGDAMAELSNEKAHSGKDSVHLETTGSEGSGDEARIVIPLPEGTTLGDIESISWWVWTVAGYPPHVDIVMDVDEDGILDDEDMLTAEMAYNNAEGIELDEGLTPTYDEWLQTFELTSDDGYGEIGDDTMLWVTKMGAGNDDAPWNTLADWKDGVVINDPGSDGLAAGVIDGNAPVLRLEIEIDNWVLQTEAYVDDIEIVIGGVTYTVGL